MSDEVINKGYKARNFWAFVFTGYFAIAIVVGLASAQTSLLVEILGINSVGSFTALLSLIDEITVLMIAPITGVVNDKVLSSGYKIGGSRIVTLLSFFLCGLSFLLYSVVTGKFGTIVGRMIFAAGFSGIMNMIPVMLNQVKHSDFTVKKLKFWRRRSPRLDDETPITNKADGRYAVFISIFTGLGALFGLIFTGLLHSIFNAYKVSEKAQVELIFFFLGLVCFALGLILYQGLYNQVGTPEQQHDGAEKLSISQLLVQGIRVSKKYKKLKLAHALSFLARSTTVVNTSFLAVLSFSYYIGTGLCSPDTPKDDTGKEGCKEAFIATAMVLGTAQLAAFLSTPLWAYLIDRTHHSMTICTSIGIVGNFGLWLASLSSKHYNPKSILGFIAVSFIGVSQYGFTINALSLVGGFKSSPNIGSISGLNSMSGSAGILIVTSVSGLLMKYFVMTPIVVLGLFNVALLYMIIVEGQDDPVELTESSEERPLVSE